MTSEAKALAVPTGSAWAVMWRSRNRLAGVTRHLICENCVPKLFVTRSDARKWIEERHGYIRRRDDLKREPHGWQMPIPVRVCITPNNEVSHGSAAKNQKL